MNTTSPAKFRGGFVVTDEALSKFLPQDRQHQAVTDVGIGDGVVTLRFGSDGQTAIAWAEICREAGRSLPEPSSADLRPDRDAIYFWMKGTEQTEFLKPLDDEGRTQIVGMLTENGFVASPILN